jgi:hypothetical protein
MVFDYPTCAAIAAFLHSKLLNGVDDGGGSGSWAEAADDPQSGTLSSPHRPLTMGGDGDAPMVAIFGASKSHWDLLRCGLMN